MAVVCASLVLPLLAVDGLHLLLEAHLIHQLLHLALVVALVPTFGAPRQQGQVVVRVHQVSVLGRHELTRSSWFIHSANVKYYDGFLIDVVRWISSRVF